MANSIFRLTNPGDTEDNVDTTEKIVFNSGSVPDRTGKMTTTSFRMVSDLNPHPNPDTKLNQIQDSLLGVVEITVTGYFKNHNATIGPRNLYNWSVDEDVNDDFRKGRFGVTLSSMNGILDVIPTTGLAGTGYMLSEIDVQDVEDPRDEVGFIARFFRNGTIDTISGKSVAFVDVTAGGTGFTTPPTVLLTGGGGTDATAIATIGGGKVATVKITNAGNNYTSAPTVSFSGGGGSGATATATIG